ncbi:hypothetical protein DMN91_012277 [Ooceraea biroi]|uniref:DUF4806 domain-containing protein n=1 Tax=Ooceraea biroi TaxID=2015173 RepID=A0A3L8D5I9_OOCBI|nr:hypothetical protein DMN91_012277 [Ooceraea biroi]
MALFRVLIAAESDVKESIAKIMSALMTKAVELLYSGTGRVVNGQCKRNFSETNSYMCLRDVLIGKFQNAIDLKKLPGRIGIWLSQAGDREGGRKARAQNTENH